MAQILVDNDADVNAKSKFNETPLYFAADAGKI